jgi:signal transduction histidine kinase/ActR/RegA family two-component response regulator
MLSIKKRPPVSGRIYQNNKQIQDTNKGPRLIFCHAHALTASVFLAVLCLLVLLAGSGSLFKQAQAATAVAADNTIATPTLARRQKQVLFLNSYSRDFFTVPQVVNHVESELKNIATIQYIFMNTKNRDHDFAFSQTQHELDYLLQKHSRFDLIIAGDDDALDFVEQHRDKYFKNIPVIFENINSEEKVRNYMRQDQNLAGLVELYPVKETIELALKLWPRTKQLVIVGDNTVSAKGTADQVLAQAENFPQLTITSLDTTLYRTEALAQKLRSYAEGTLIWYGVFSIDGSGRHYDIADGAAFISNTARVPTIKADEAGIGDGIFGGCALSYEAVGQQTGIMARKILTGAATVSMLGYRTSDSNYVFDRQQLDRFKISKSKLPPETMGAIFKNEAPGFYEQHSTVVWAFTGLIMLITIIGLMNDRQRNRAFNEKLTAQKTEIKAAELANQAKTDFLSRMSHDIRTPLNAIIGLTTLAKDDIHDPVRMQDNLDKIHTSGAILLELLNDVLDVGRIESGKLSLQTTPFAFAEFLQGIHLMFDEVCNRRGQTFTIDTNMSDKVILTDKVRFTQIIANLINNASKFTPPGGWIKFTATCGEITDGLLPCTFVVADNGQGMSPEFQRKMFEAFTQEHNATGNMEKGSGLGLAIVKKITELMHGVISVHSAPGKGSAFTLQFNFVPVTGQAAKALVKPTNLSALRDHRILLVEDHPLNAQIATRMLEKQKMLVETAENGLVAVEKFRQSAPGYYDAILMDIRMPVLDGHAATKQIRALPRADARTIPIIAMTADAFDGDVKHSLASGMNAHLNKPVNPEELYRTLAKFVQK